MAVLGQQHPPDEVVEQVSAALDEGHAASLIGLDQAATANLLRGLAQVASRLDALTATVLAHATQVRVEETNGATTTATWWADATNRTRATAHRDVKLAVALTRHTALAEALAEGRVNTEQAHAIARALADLETDGPADLQPVTRSPSWNARTPRTCPASVAAQVPHQGPAARDRPARQDP